MDFKFSKEKCIRRGLIEIASSMFCEITSKTVHMNRMVILEEEEIKHWIKVSQSKIEIRILSVFVYKGSLSFT